MDILVHPANGSVTPLWQSTPFNTDEYYPLEGHPGYQFVVRMQGTPRKPRTTVLIQIATEPVEGQSRRKSRKTVQSGRIQTLSAVAGRHSDTGKPREHIYKLDLHPDRPIWPLTNLIDRLMAAGLKSWQITPMETGYPLFDNCATHSNPEMLTDGDLTKDANTGGERNGEELLPSIDFTVKDASWAILHFPDSQLSGGVSHLYLWPHAADKADEILDTVQKLQAEAEKAAAIA